MSGHYYDGTTYKKLKTLAFPDNTTGVMRTVKEAYIWNGSAFVLVYIKPALLTDDFNRANGTIGNAWDRGLMANPEVRIVSNACHGGVLANNTGRQACCWVKNWTSLNRDTSYVKAKLVAPVSSIANDNYTTLFLAAPDAWGSGVFVYLSVSTGSSSYIVTCNGLPNGAGNAATGGSNQTVRATGVSISAADTIEFRRTKNFSTGQFTYAGYRNGSATSFLSWTDTAGVVPSGLSTRRRWGFCIEGNDPLIGGPYASPGIDWIEAGDL